MQVKKQQLEPVMEQWTGSKLGKEYIKAVYSHPAYLTHMQNTSCKCQLSGKILVTSDMQRIPESEEELKSLLMKVKEESEKLA